MRDVLSCRCGKFREYVLVSRDAVTVVVETVRGVVGRAQEENSANIIIIPEEYMHSSKCNSRNKSNVVESSDTCISSPGLNFPVCFS